MDSKAAENLVGVLKSIVREELGARERANEAVDDFDPRAGHRWSNAEDAQLIREVRAAATVIAVLHKRNLGGVISRIEKLAKEARLGREDG